MTPNVALIWLQMWPWGHMGKILTKDGKISNGLSFPNSKKLCNYLNRNPRHWMDRNPRVAWTQKHIRDFHIPIKRDIRKMQGCQEFLEKHEFRSKAWHVENSSWPSHSQFPIFVFLLNFQVPASFQMSHFCPDIMFFPNLWSSSVAPIFSCVPFFLEIMIPFEFGKSAATKKNAKSQMFLRFAHIGPIGPIEPIGPYGITLRPHLEWPKENFVIIWRQHFSSPFKATFKMRSIQWKWHQDPYFYMIFTCFSEEF